MTNNVSSSPAFPIRVSSPAEDLEIGLRKLCATWDFWTYDNIKGIVDNPAYTLFYHGALDDLTGFLLVQNTGEEIDIIYLYVDPSQRKKGLGLALLQSMEKHLQAPSSSTTIYLEVRKSNTAAINLYQQFGMILRSERKKYYQDGEDALIFIKVI
jgi:ribosomal protein S18 acetylase RimI-like enzyme